MPPTEHQALTLPVPIHLLPSRSNHITDRLRQIRAVDNPLIQTPPSVHAGWGKEETNLWEPKSTPTR